MQRGLRGLTQLGISNLLIKPAWFLFIAAACPRVLGPDGYGQMQTALALATLVFAFSDLGINNLVVREVARRPSRGLLFFRHAIPHRLVAVSVAALVTTMIGWATGQEASMAAAAFAAATGLGTLATAFYRAYGRLEAEALATGAERMMMIGCGTLALLWTRSAAGVLAAMAAVALTSAFLQGTWVRRTLLASEPTRHLFRASLIGTLMVMALPMGLTDLLQTAYMRSQQILVDGWLGSTAAGHYAQAARIIEMASLVPALIVQSYLFPRLSTITTQSHLSAFQHLLRRSVFVLTAIGIAVASVLSLGAARLIPLLTSDPGFGPSISVLQILAWAFPFTCIKDLCYISDLSRRHYRTPTIIFLSAFICNVALSSFLLPRLGVTGGAVSTVVVEASVALLYGFSLYRRYR